MGDHTVLPHGVRPRHYNLALRGLDLVKWTYEGTVSIHVELLEPQCRSIAINASRLELKHAQVLVDGAPAAEATSFDADDRTQVVRIKLDRELPATREATVVISFRGKIGDSLTGFYRSKYKPAVDQVASVVRDGDGSHYALSTQLAASYARRAFPCFDAPNLKATFALSIEVPSDQVALSNMPVRGIEPSGNRAGWQVVTFHTTPVMSTYLLAWAVGDFAYLEAFTEQSYNGRKVPVRVYTTRGLEAQGAFALAIAPAVIDLFSGIFDIPYPLDKMDLLAVPEMSLSGMEHWGLITSQSGELLFDEHTSSEAVKRSIADNVSHELAHQWFGNLVTMNWWDELWLNEGFATWVGHHAVDQLFPEWKVWAHFAVGRMESAFQADGLRASHAVHIPAGSGLQDHQIFDQISYGKGCAVIRMLAAHVGTETFLKGVSRYLKANAYGSATARALWDSLEELSGTDIVGMAGSWIECVGYPVVVVTEDADRCEISVRQSRFLTSGDVKPEDDTTLWHVPLGIPGLDGDDGFLVTKQKSIAGVDLGFYTLNNQGTGFYRVAYPHSRLAKLGTQLDRLTAADKISIIGSAAALASAGCSCTTSLLSFLQGFCQENDLVVWEQILDVLDKVAVVFSEDAQIRAGLMNFVLQLTEHKVAELGTDPRPEDDFSTRGLRRALLVSAVKCGHVRTVDIFASRFDNWAERGVEIEPSMRRIAFRAAMQKHPRTSFALLQAELAKAAPSVARGIILSAMAGTDDEPTLRQLVALLWSPSVSVNDLPDVLFALAYHPIGRHVQWEWTKSYWDALTAMVGDALLLDQFVQVILLGFSSEDAVADVDAFFANKDTEAFESSLERGKEEIRGRASHRKRDSARLEQWLAENNYL